jgi:hypothetical protein
MASRPYLVIDHDRTGQFPLGTERQNLPSAVKSRTSRERTATAAKRLTKAAAHKLIGALVCS